MFKVEGWNVNSNSIAKDASNNKQKKSKNNKKVHEQKQKEKFRNRVDNNSYDNVNRNEKEVTKALNNTIKEDKKVSKKSDSTAKKEKKLVQQSTSAIDIASTSNTKLTPLQQKLFNKLKGSRFRWINEQLYTNTSSTALDLITKQPELFDEYHKGFREQVTTWPINPLDIMIKNIKTRFQSRNLNAPGGLPAIDRTCVVADMGCGEAALSLEINQYYDQHKKKFEKQNKHLKVHSFDLAKHNDRITVADIKNVPMENEECCIVIFSLSLMGVNFLDFIKEAFRILKPNGELWIAEIKSRFKDQSLKEFIKIVEQLGFRHKLTKTLEEEGDDKEMFIRFEFFKPDERTVMEMKERQAKRTKFLDSDRNEDEDVEARREKQPESEWLLKPCIYKRR
jgi:ribosomal RNA-processing protein 8